MLVELTPLVAKATFMITIFHLRVRSAHMIKNNCGVASKFIQKYALPAMV
jgi:hypothetical protein